MPPIENQKSKIENPNDTGLPVLRTWPAVYTFVLAFFLLLVILLTLFTATYGPNPLEALLRAFHLRPSA